MKKPKIPYAIIVSSFKNKLNSREMIELATAYYNGCDLVEYISENQTRFCMHNRSSLVINAKRKNDTYYSKGQEILVSPFNEHGYGAYAIQGATVKEESTRLEDFLHDCENYYSSFLVILDEYIKTVLEHSEEVTSYIKNVLSKDRCTVFKWIYFYNEEAKCYERYLFPLIDELEVTKIVFQYYYYIPDISKRIITDSSEYSSHLLNIKLTRRKNDEDDPLVYVGEETIADYQDFEVLANIYELLYNKELLNELSSVIEEKKARYRRR